MLLIKINRFKRIIIFAILPFLLSCSIFTPGVAQNRNSGEIQATNIRWKIADDIITIKYDLVAPPNETYKVSVFLKKESDSTFIFNPVSLEGDVGKGEFSGTSREIRWRYGNDIEGFNLTDDYYFEVQVKSTAFFKKWMYYALGAAVVTGGLIAIISSGGNGTTNTVVELPVPPGRP
jgi:hypothetical protein